MEDPEIRSRFHRAYDEIALPAPWLEMSVREGRRQHSRPRQLRWPWIVGAAAVILIVAIALGVIVSSRGLRQPSVPAAHGTGWCLGINPLIPDEGGAATPASALPGVVPPGFHQECAAHSGSGDTPAAVAAYYQRALTNAGWRVNTDGPIQGFVVTTWTPDPSVSGGPEPRYKPAFTGLSGDDVASAASALDSTGTTWLVNVRLTARGAGKLAEITRANVAACPGDPNVSQAANCPQRHLAFWVRLTQDDIDHWGDSGYAAGTSAPFDSAGGPQNAYPALIEDALTLQPITGGELQIAASSRESADYLAEGFNTRLLGTHIQLTFTRANSFGVIDLVPAGNATAIWVRVVS